MEGMRSGSSRSRRTKNPGTTSDLAYIDRDRLGFYRESVPCG